MTTIPGVADVEAHVREITEDEVAAYREQGWVSLPGLLTPELAGSLLDHLKHVTGLDYDELPRDHPEAEAVATRIRDEGLAKIFYMSRLHDEVVWNIVTARALGEA